jgi:2-dehydro-3-deoxyphosphogluconate aldolase / (4S)-4-hydroxy-2-oxoglutarate aldolase
MTHSSPHTPGHTTDALLRRVPVIPVIVIDRLDQAVPLARALVAGGLDVIEITLRTPVAMDAMRAIIAEVEGAIVGAGTVRTPDQLASCAKLGCAFAVSPGYTTRLLDAAKDSPCPLLPGAATAAEMMTLADHGFTRQKFFPAGPAGGPAYLKAVASPLPDILFCPTGGIDSVTAKDYLKLKNVLCVGGSWVTPTSAIQNNDWTTITRLAKDACTTGRFSGG